MRENVPAADEILYKYFPVLDKGFVSLVDYMGSDLAIERAARISYGKATRKISDTKNLLRYLLRNKHTSPFEQVELKFNMALPIFVARQLIRHRTFSFNEYSGRYSEVPEVYFTPHLTEVAKQSDSNKQGSSTELVYNESEYKVRMRERELENNGSFREYKIRLEEGWSKELARIDLPLSTYTYWYCKVDLHNLFHFLRLRCDGHAQFQIRVFADVMAGIAKRLCPLSFDAWIDYSFCAKNFSRLDILFLQYLGNTYCDGFRMSDWQCSYETDCDASSENSYHKQIGMSEREIQEFWTKLTPAVVLNFDLNLSTAKTAEEMEAVAK